MTLSPTRRKQKQNRRPCISFDAIQQYHRHEAPSPLDSNQSGIFTQVSTRSLDDDGSHALSNLSKTWEDVIDAAKAAELDQLIQSGNWAAIVEAAARYSTKEEKEESTPADALSSG